MRDEESQVDRSLDAMNRLAHRAADAGVVARPVSFLSDNVGRDLADIAATQQCDAILLGFHRASLDSHVVRALVHRVFKLAPCDVAVFVDRRGDGVRAESNGAVLAVITSDADDGAMTRIAHRLAESLETNVKPLRLPGGGLSELISESETAAAAVVAVGQVLAEGDDFDRTASAVAESAECPVLVVRPSTVHVSIRPGLGSVKTRAHARHA